MPKGQGYLGGKKPPRKGAGKVSARNAKGKPKPSKGGLKGPKTR